MKAALNFEDGKVVELSEETTDRLREELIKDDGQLEVGKFRAKKSHNGFLFAIMEYRSDKWDGEMKSLGSNAEATHYLMLSEVKKIIAGLTRMFNE